MGLVIQTHWKLSRWQPAGPKMWIHKQFTPVQAWAATKKSGYPFSLTPSPFPPLPLTWCPVASSWKQRCLVLIGLFAWRLSKMTSWPVLLGGIQPLESPEPNRPTQGSLAFGDSEHGSGYIRDLGNDCRLKGTIRLCEQGLKSVRCTLLQKTSNILLLGAY